MKKIIAIALSLAVFGAYADKCPQAVDVTASLGDGTVLKGTFKNKRIKCSTAFSEKLALDPALVRTCTFTGKDGAAKIELVNGDAFSATVATESFRVKTILGPLDLPVDSIKSLAFRAKKKCGADDKKGLVFHCTFDDEASVTSPAVGPAGKLGESTFVDGKVGKACRVPRKGSAGAFAFPPGMIKDEGCVEFWAKLETNKSYYGDCDPRIVFMTSPVGWFTVEYSSNNGGGLGGFCVRCFGLDYIKGGTFGRHYSYSDTVGEDVNGWHHYAFSWEKDALTVFIDGKALPMRKYSANAAIDGVKLASGPCSLGLPNDNIRESWNEPGTPFVIDEMKIWDYAKTEFDL